RRCRVISFFFGLCVGAAAGGCLVMEARRKRREAERRAELAEDRADQAEERADYWLTMATMQNRSLSHPLGHVVEPYLGFPDQQSLIDVLTQSPTTYPDSNA